MKQRTALILTTVITAFILVLVGGVAASLMQPDSSQARPAAPLVATAEQNQTSV